MQSYKIISSVAFAAVTFLPVAHAEDFYAEGFIAAFNTDDAVGISGSENLLLGTVGGRGGFAFNDHFSLEGELQTAAHNEEIYLFVEEAHVSLRSNAAVFGRFSLPLGERFNVYGRIGYSSSVFEVSGASIDDSETFDGGAYGVGATFDLTDKIYLRGDATRYDTGAIESDSLSIGAGLRF